MKIGDKVIINDHSMAHRNTGTIYSIQSNGFIIVELDEEEEGWIMKGMLWSLVSEKELIKKS
jgi:hypothetical protein